MSETQPRMPWRRVAAEGVIIVVSILLAFGIDAWWDSRRDRAAEKALLSAVAEDLEQAQADISLAIERNRTVAETLDAFMAVGPGTLSRMPEDSAQVMLDFLLRFDTYAPIAGPMRSGGFTDLSSQALRETLATWSGLEANVVERTAITLELLKDLRLAVTPDVLLALGDAGVEPNAEGAPEALAWMRSTDAVVVTLLTLDGFAVPYLGGLEELSTQTDIALERLRGEDR